MAILEIINGIYGIIVGVSLNLFWIVVYSMKITDKLIENPFERSFHVIAELFISILALISGIVILLREPWGFYLFLLSMGALVYACINAVGIYGKKKIWLLVVTLATVALYR